MSRAGARRLVAQGFGQTKGVDYTDTYAPVVHYKSIRVIAALVATLDYEFKQMDVPTAFLNATLTDQVYMKFPEGMTLPAGITPKSHCLILLKSLYGIKQAPREWNLALNASIRSIGYTRGTADTCVYTKLSKTGRNIIVPIFVDDIFPACHTLDLAEMTTDMDKLRDMYNIPPMEDADVILGMRVTRSRPDRTLALDQSLYITRLIDSYNMQAATPAPAPESKHYDRKFAPDDPRAPPPSPALQPHDILL